MRLSWTDVKDTYFRLADERQPLTFPERLSSAPRVRLTIMRALLVLACALCLPAAKAAVDGTSLEHLNGALTAYQHDHGELPLALGDLVPHYIPAIPEGCSYDFGADPAPADFSAVLSPHAVPKHASTRDLRVIEERYFGDAVPIATCNSAYVCTSLLAAKFIPAGNRGSSHHSQSQPSWNG